MRMIAAVCISLIAGIQVVQADPPTANYVFPAGGQRGTSIEVRVGGCNLHREPILIWSGSGIAASPLRSVETIWFEGPVIPQPASQQKEDYPRDFASTLAIDADAPLGRQTWRLKTSQGVTSAWGFVVGALPEVVEREIDGNAPTVRVELPVTINGRIFPREDVDAWSFSARKGQRITCRVATSEFGSPLEACVDVIGPDGHVIAEKLPEGSVTPDVRFIASTDGEYRVRVRDVAFGGLQDHVYRLTLTSGPVLDRVYPLGGQRGSATGFELQGSNLSATRATVTLPMTGSDYVWRLTEDQAIGEARLDLDNFTEVLEVEANDVQPFTIPSVLNGRIQSPSDVDLWQFTAKKGQEYDFEVKAARLGSPLDSVLELLDSAGKKLAEADDSQGIQTDARLRWTAPADGEFRLAIRDRLDSRGDNRFAYRIRAVSAEQPEFSLSSTVDTLILERGKTANLKVSADRGPGFKGPIELRMEGLPAGVSVSSPTGPIVIPENQREVQLVIKAQADAKVESAVVRMTGHAKVADRDQSCEVVFLPANAEQGRVAVPDANHRLWLAVAVPTPFRFVGVFETKFISRGAVFVRRYNIDRNGYEGPLVVQLADRQGRHLQGVTATPVTVPAGVTAFEFAVTLPPWMEIGRTCRSTLAVVGTVADPDGTQHVVSYSSNDQNNQMIALVDPGRFAIQLQKSTLAVKPGQTLSVPIRIQRGPGLTNRVTVEVIASNALQGISADKLEVSGDATGASLTLKCADGLSGTEVRPLTIRATTLDERGLPVTAETSLELVGTGK